MDIKKLNEKVEQQNEGAVVVIYDEAGDAYKAEDGSDATMTVVGSESKRYRDAQKRQQRRLMKRARFSRGDVSPEELEADAIELSASAVIEWHGWEDGGTPLPCTPENVRAVLGIAHIHDQVVAVIQRHAAFFARSSGD